MDHSVKKITLAVFSLMALTFGMHAKASTHSEAKPVASGTIHFVGAIVASPCVITSIEQSIDTKCWNDDGAVKTTSVKFNKLTEKGTVLPNHKGTQTFKWINKENKIGVYTVIYD
ncbi:hypothetical protein M5X66_10150 [Providencia sp. PROV188]|uniref:Type 1 fimbrial protein n=1 Tax=Providencia alcalifaciens TaxID=126385 RepID=A0A4R3NPG1_9GAMM|nr:MULTISPECIES: hypothetical protein [Providencia]MBC5790872.1 hypothetical protein [Providencia sp. JUb39]MBS0925701.1 hypothetical protein [Providencia sp. JGM181]MBS0932938.1 hypothetical protein [Providencia sp. JGM172]MBS0997131.1 hypothetical protein [Providencia sp. JGM178]MTB45278.1 hypothetical protein [Providencia sp. wls1950]MTC21957.1 hypothetical protein [Providencia sp. wls1938]MTC46490.1 hypothetical protein [Providencia sp. wls1922]MTC77809.1 hypothetical protein [Providenc